MTADSSPEFFACGAARGCVHEPGTIQLRQRRLFIFPTAAGFLYLTVVIAMFLGSTNYDLALGYALTFFLAALGLVGMLHTYRNLLGLTLHVQDAEPVMAGENARFRLALVNAARRPRPSLEWQGGVHPEAQTIHLAAAAETILEIDVLARDRGWLTLPNLRVASRYPLGLLVAWANVWPTARCLVYPRPRFVPLPERADAAGEGASFGREGQDDFAGLRERQPADSLRHVAWKNAARDPDGLKPLLIKCFEGGSTRHLRLDWQLTAGDLETRVSTLAGWVLAAEAAGLEYALTLPGRETPFALGPTHRHRCLRLLALYAGTA